jgi:hypothetical protein
MFGENPCNVPNGPSIRGEGVWSSVRGPANFERVPESTSDFVFRKTTNVCAMKANMFSFCYRVRLLLCALSKLCLGYSLMEVGKEILMQLQNLGEVLLDGYSRLNGYGGDGG